MQSQSTTNVNGENRQQAVSQQSNKKDQKIYKKTDEEMRQIRRQRNAAYEANRWFHKPSKKAQQESAAAFQEAHENLLLEVEQRRLAYELPVRSRIQREARDYFSEPKEMKHLDPNWKCYGVMPCGVEEEAIVWGDEDVSTKLEVPSKSKRRNVEIDNEIELTEGQKMARRFLKAVRRVRTTKWWKKQRSRFSKILPDRLCCYSKIPQKNCWCLHKSKHAEECSACGSMYLDDHNCGNDQYEWDSDNFSNTPVDSGSYDYSYSSERMSDSDSITCQSFQDDDLNWVKMNDEAIQSRIIRGISPFHVEEQMGKFDEEDDKEGYACTLIHIYLKEIITNIHNIIGLWSHEHRTEIRELCISLLSRCKEMDKIVGGAFYMGDKSLDNNKSFAQQKDLMFMYTSNINIRLNQCNKLVNDAKELHRIRSAFFVESKPARVEVGIIRTLVNESKEVKVEQQMQSHGDANLAMPHSRPSTKVAFTNDTARDENLMFGLNHQTNITNILDRCKIPSRLDTFSYSSSVTAGTALARYRVSPNYCPRFVDTTVRTYNQTTLCNYANMYQFWKGSLIYTIEVVRTTFHMGQLFIAFNPASIAAPSFTQCSNLVYKIMDIKEKNRMDFEVEYVGETEYKQCVSSAFGPAVPTDAYLNIANVGTLNIFAFTPLTAPTLVAPAIDVNVYVRAGNNFTFKTPTQKTANLKYYNVRGDVVEEMETEYDTELEPVVAQPMEGMSSSGEQLEIHRAAKLNTAGTGNIATRKYPLSIGIAWDTTDSIVAPISITPLPSAVLTAANLSINGLINYHAYFRGKFTMIFEMNAPLQYAGMLIMFYVPNGVDYTKCANATWTQFPHVFFNPANETIAELDIPWSYVTPMNSLDPNGSLNVMGRVYIVPWNNLQIPVSGVNTLTGTLSFKMIDPKIIMKRSNYTYATGIQVEEQMEKVSGGSSEEVKQTSESALKTADTQGVFQGKPKTMEGIMTQDHVEIYQLLKRADFAPTQSSTVPTTATWTQILSLPPFFGSMHNFLRNAFAFSNGANKITFIVPVGANRGVTLASYPSFYDSTFSDTISSSPVTVADNIVFYQGTSIWRPGLAFEHTIEVPFYHRDPVISIPNIGNVSQSEYANVLLSAFNNDTATEVFVQPCHTIGDDFKLYFPIAYGAFQSAIPTRETRREETIHMPSRVPEGIPARIPVRGEIQPMSESAAMLGATNNNALFDRLVSRQQNYPTEFKVQLPDKPVMKVPPSVVNKIIEHVILKAPPVLQQVAQGVHKDIGRSLLEQLRHSHLASILERFSQAYVHAHGIRKRDVSSVCDKCPVFEDKWPDHVYVPFKEGREGYELDYDSVFIHCHNVYAFTNVDENLDVCVEEQMPALNGFSGITTNTQVISQAFPSTATVGVINTFQMTAIATCTSNVSTDLVDVTYTIGNVTDSMLMVQTVTGTQIAPSIINMTFPTIPTNALIDVTITATGTGVIEHSFTMGVYTTPASSGTIPVSITGQPIRVTEYANLTGPRVCKHRKEDLSYNCKCFIPIKQGVHKGQWYNIDNAKNCTHDFVDSLGCNCWYEDCEPWMHRIKFSIEDPEVIVEEQMPKRNRRVPKLAKRRVLSTSKVESEEEDEVRCNSPSEFYDAEENVEPTPEDEAAMREVECDVMKYLGTIRDLGGSAISGFNNALTSIKNFITGSCDQHIKRSFCTKLKGKLQEISDNVLDKIIPVIIWIIDFVSNLYVLFNTESTAMRTLMISSISAKCVLAYRNGDQLVNKLEELFGISDVTLQAPVYENLPLITGLVSAAMISGIVGLLGYNMLHSQVEDVRKLSVWKFGEVCSMMSKMGGAVKAVPTLWTAADTGINTAIAFFLEGPDCFKNWEQKNHEKLVMWQKKYDDGVSKNLFTNAQLFQYNNGQTNYSLLGELVEFAKEVRIYGSAIPHFNSVWLRTAESMMKVHATAHKQMQSAAGRSEPVGIIVRGAAGCGKSLLFTQFLPHAVMNKLGLSKSLKESKEKTYAKPTDPKADFWDGYLGSQHVWVNIDDFGQVRTEEDIGSMYNLISASDAPVNMADLADKGILFVSDFVCCTTNLTNFTSLTTIRDSSALVRRFPVALSCKVNDAYKKADGTLNHEAMITHLKTADANAIAFYRAMDAVWTFHTYDYKLGSNGITLSVEEVVDRIADAYTARKQGCNDFTALLDKITAPIVQQQMPDRVKIGRMWSTTDSEDESSDEITHNPVHERQMFIARVLGSIGNDWSRMSYANARQYLREIRFLDIEKFYGVCTNDYHLARDEHDLQISATSCSPVHFLTMIARLRSIPEVKEVNGVAPSFWPGFAKHCLKWLGIVSAGIAVVLLLNKMLNMIFKMLMKPLSIQSQGPMYDNTKHLKTHAPATIPIRGRVAQVTHQMDEKQTVVSANIRFIRISFADGRVLRMHCLALDSKHIVIPNHYYEVFCEILANEDNQAQFQIERRRKGILESTFDPISITGHNSIQVEGIGQTAGRKFDLRLIYLSGYVCVGAKSIWSHLMDCNDLGFYANSEQHCTFLAPQFGLLGQKTLISFAEWFPYNNCIFLLGKCAITTVNGECGRPYVHMSKNAQHCLVGLHALGLKNDPNRNVGLSPLIRESLEMSKFLLSQMLPIAPHIDPLVVEEIADFKLDVIPTEISKFWITPAMPLLGLPSINGVKLARYTPIDTKYRPISVDGRCFYHQNWVNDYTPSKKVTVKIGDKLIHPLFSGAQKYAATAVFHPPIHYTLNALNHYSKKIPIDSDARALTFDEALNGFKNMGHLIMTTGAGYWGIWFSGKSDIFTPIEQQVRADGSLQTMRYDWSEKAKNFVVPIWKKTLVEFYDECDETIQMGKCMKTFWVSTLKDELVSAEKARIAKTRVFEQPCVVYTLLCRKYFGHFAEIYKQHAGFRLHHGIGKDKNVVWAKYLEVLRSHSGYGFDLDYKNYDGTVHPAAFEFFLHLTDQYYGFDNQLARHSLIRTLQCSHHLIGIVLSESYQGNKSGNPLTDLFNSITNVWFIYVAYQWCQVDNGMDPDMSLQHKDFDMLTYGDDVIIGATEDCLKYFNRGKVAEIATYFGMTVTAANKEAKITPYDNIFDLTFLKSPFIVRCGYVAAPLPKKVIYRELTWETTNCVGNKTILDERIKIGLEFMAHHGYDDYQQLRKELAQLGVQTEDNFQEWETNMREKQSNPDVEDGVGRIKTDSTDYFMREVEVPDLFEFMDLGDLEWLETPHEEG